MGWAPTKRTEDWRGAGLAMAVFALLINVLIPQGYMTSAGPQGPSLVICSGNGPVSIAPSDLARPQKAPKSKPDMPCAFAAHGVASAPMLSVMPAMRTSAIATSARIVLADRAPGRGLAAPPPPSQAPPIYL